MAVVWFNTIYSGTSFAIASIIIGFGFWDWKNWAGNIKIILIYIEITLLIILIACLQTLYLIIQLFGIYNLIPLIYTIGKDLFGLYYLSRANVKFYVGQIKKQQVGLIDIAICPF